MRFHKNITFRQLNNLKKKLKSNDFNKWYNELHYDEVIGLYCVMIHNNDFVGGVKIIPHIKYNMISNVFITPKYRGMGLCKKIMSKATSDQKMKYRLQVLSSNTSAIKCYKSAGFKIRYYDEDGDPVMSK